MGSEIKFGKLDVAVIAGLLILAWVAFYCIHLSAKTGGEVSVYVDNELYDKRQLDSDSVISVMLGGETVNVIHITQGQAFMESATCPDKLCMHQGSVSRLGENIVCLPHRVVVSITEGGEGDVDAVSS